MSFENRFEIRFIRVDKSQMMMEGIPKRRAIMLKTMSDKCNIDTTLGEEIEGRKAKLTRQSV